jgi:NAD(P)-dependent dehydrogenase (short-subunit alcohol dehydrogenase family)
MVPDPHEQGLIKRFEERMLEDITLKRFGSPEDLRGVVFLASPAAYITGQTIVVDGGATAW